MNLSHFTDAATLEVRSVEQRARYKMKPRGLWVSVDGPDDWPSWCASEQFRDTDSQNRFRVTLADDANILVIATAAELDAFDAEYGDAVNGLELIEWTLVAARWQGIIIAPYQWARRNGKLWYYGWDCASGCIWDASAIASVEPVEVDAEAVA